MTTTPQSPTPQSRWHAKTEDLDRYCSGQMSESGAASIESHLLACAECRARVTPSVPVEVLDRMWAATTDRVDAPKRSWFERLTTTVGMPPSTARLTALTPAVRASYLLAVAAISALAVFAANEKAGPTAFVLAAPLLCVAGVAVAYSATDRGVRELETSTTFGGLRLLLLRTATVVASSMAICGIASLFLQHVGLESAAWLLPAVALTSTCLAISTRTTPWRSVTIVAAGWVLLVLVAYARMPRDVRPTDDSLGPIGLPLQLFALLLLVASTAVFTARRETVDLPTH
jgi:hypothetical protein